MASKREYDINGWFEVKDNPISKVGVFPYTGAQIDPEGEFGLDPDKIYNVFRPAESLNDPECIESFKLVPWIDNHTMLGNEGNSLTPAEKKGVSGTTGEAVYFDAEELMLKANIKIFSEDLKAEIQKGKRELSLGYRCEYEKKPGVFKGERYEFIQKTIRGNHLASVDEGRMGPDVAVLDSSLTFTFDSKELVMDLEKLIALVETLVGRLDALEEAAKPAEDMEEKPAEDAEASEKKEAEDEEKPAEDAEAEKPAEDAEKACDEDPDKKEAMDSLKETCDGLKKDIGALRKNGIKTIMGEIGKRDALAGKLSAHIGTFDHSAMTLDEVAVYGAGKLELKCDKGAELASINGYLHGRTAPAAGFAFDAATRTGASEVDAFIKEEV